uniref:2-dehydropantoate 2-reductase n=2 Tax=Rhodosorus marinus TaxID=101924 RepID=A0A7S0BLB8_9RHOD|mmetsp:Transcript_22198/g.32122  ORF Transcript_22198/g.32122 Transcript_22198/m.32122 type:complete len:326 (+) Transcript_22198:242-1219(+)
MKVVIYGAGGVGAFYGSALLKAGCDVRFIGRGKHLEAMQDSGLRIKRSWKPDNDEVVESIEAVGGLNELDGFIPDYVFVCVKYRDLEDVTEACKSLPESVCFVSLLNGVDAVETLAAAFGSPRVIAGSCVIISYVVEPGTILVQDSAYTILLGEWEGPSDSARVREICSLFTKAEVENIVMQDARSALWTKLISMGALGPISAVTRASVNEILSVPETRELLRQTMEEIKSVAKAVGVKVDVSVESTLKRLDKSENRHDLATVSTLRDVRDGLPTELEYLSGRIVHLGKLHNAPTPLSSTLYAALLPQHLRASNFISQRPDQPQI